MRKPLREADPDGGWRCVTHSKGDKGITVASPTAHADAADLEAQMREAASELDSADGRSRYLRLAGQLHTMKALTARDVDAAVRLSKRMAEESGAAGPGGGVSVKFTLKAPRETAPDGDADEHPAVVQ